MFLTKLRGGNVVKLKKISVFLVSLLFILSITGVYTAYAASPSTNASGSISGGSFGFFSVPSTATFSNVQLNGDMQTTKASIGDIIAYDASGNGIGWNVTVQANQFTEVAPTGGFKSGTTAKTLQAGSLTLQAPIEIIGYSLSGNGKPTKSPAPIAAAGSPWTIDSANGCNAVKLVTAAQSKGMGGYSISFANDCLSLTLDPATTFVDNINYPGQPTPYSTNLTWTITTGP